MVPSIVMTVLTLLLWRMASRASTIVPVTIRSFWKDLLSQHELLCGAMRIHLALRYRAHGLQSEINNGIQEMTRSVWRTASEEKM